MDEHGDVSIVNQTSEGEVHVYAHPSEPIMVHRDDGSKKKVFAPVVVPAREAYKVNLQFQYQK